MARIRTIKPEFWSSEQIMECSLIARLMFIGLWNFCDDAGNHSASLKTIKAEIFPGDDIDSENIRQLLDELSSNGLIVFYSNENKDFLHVTGWHHQKIDRPSFKHPPYKPEKSKTIRRTIDDQSPPEGSLKEGKGEEGKGEECEEDQSPEDLLGDHQPSDPPADEVAIVVATYNRTLPDCQSVQVLNPKRRKRIVAVCKLARKVCQQQGWRYTVRGFWTAYWTECLGDDWLAGRKANPKNPSWKQNLDVLLEEDRFAGIMDRAIAAMRLEEAA